MTKAASGECPDAGTNTMSKGGGKDIGKVNLKIVGPGKEKAVMCIRKDADIREIVDWLHAKTGYAITFLMQGTHALNMTKRLADYNIQEGTEIKAVGTLDGGMDGSEREVEDRESEPEAENKQAGVCILTDETIPPTAADREPAARSTALRLVQDE